MPNKSKIKGDIEERAVILMHRQSGIPAKRTLESGKRSDGSETYDVDIYPFGEENAALVGECKIRASGFKQIYDWLGINDFLTVRADRKERLYIVPERVWLQLLKQRADTPQSAVGQVEKILRGEGALV